MTAAGSGLGNEGTVDAHHHLWDLSAVSYPWLQARGVRRFFGDPTPIQRDYLPADYRADTAPWVVQSVHVQAGAAAGAEVDEAAWVQAIGEGSGVPAATVAFCDLAAPDAHSVLDRLSSLTRVRGVRQIVGRERRDDAGTDCGRVLGDPAWEAGLAAVAARGLSFDLQLVPEQHDAAAAVLGRVPGLRVAVCHCGSPWDQSRAGLSAWRQGLQRLADLPGSVCKVSGFGMFDPGWTASSIEPIVAACWDVFGPARTMFASNFPVDKIHRNFDFLMGAHRAVAERLTAAERALYFGDTARGFYRLPAFSPRGPA